MPALLPDPTTRSSQIVFIISQHLWRDMEIDHNDEWRRGWIRLRSFLRSLALIGMTIWTCFTRSLPLVISYFIRPNRYCSSSLFLCLPCSEALLAVTSCDFISRLALLLCLCHRAIRYDLSSLCTLSEFVLSPVDRMIGFFFSLLFFLRWG
jgi:hypothetical protein